jgi:hypothetical protein
MEQHSYPHTIGLSEQFLSRLTGAKQRCQLNSQEAKKST